MSDLTSALQQAIWNACEKGQDQNKDASTFSKGEAIATLQLQKGDYPVQTLEIPRNCKILLYSKDRVRLLYLGKRNRPLFVLKENSKLVLTEKLEIYYNTNNVQEVLKLMIRCPQGSHAEISPQVKLSLFSLKQQ